MLKKFTFSFLLLWLIVSYNSVLRNTSMPFIGFGLNIVLEGIILVLTAQYLLPKFNIYKKWVIIVLIYWGLSVIWSVNSNSFEFYWKYGLIYLLFFSVSAIVKTKKDVELLMKLDLTAVFFVAYMCYFS